jgi:hypothetical protein
MYLVWVHWLDFKRLEPSALRLELRMESDFTLAVVHFDSPTII